MNYAYEMIQEIYTLNKKGYTIARMCREDINVFGVINDDGDIVITISETKKIKE